MYNTIPAIMKVNYRIDELELRLGDLGTQNEIIYWHEYRDTGSSETKQCCTSIAIFHYDKDGYPELSYVGDRPCKLDNNKSKIFMELVKEGYKYTMNEYGNLVKD